MKNVLILIFLISFSLADNIIEPLPLHIKYNKNKVNLGRELFYDTGLSRDNDVACISCHFNYGADNTAVGEGTHGALGSMNSPTVFNVKYEIAYFWNGRANTLEKQMAIGPIVNPVEMNSSKEVVMNYLSKSKKYQKLFKEAYNQKPSYKLALDAIAKFEDTLISSESKFDKYLRGKIKLSKDEAKGYELFKSYGCISCHNGINIGDNSYQKFGAVIPCDKNKNKNKKWEDRYKVTKQDFDENVYKVPSLRNVAETAPYFHDGRTKTLKKAIKDMVYHNVGTQLSDKEISEIESFLKTLTGKVPETFEKKTK